MKMTNEEKPALDRNEIAKIAYRLWEQEGRPAGRDLEHWVRAEKLVLSSGKPPTNRQPASTLGILPGGRRNNGGPEVPASSNSRRARPLLARRANGAAAVPAAIAA